MAYDYDRAFKLYGTSTKPGGSQYNKFKDINKNPGKYTAKEIQDIWNSSLRIDQSDFQRNIGSDDDDYVDDVTAYNAAVAANRSARNALMTQARNPVIDAQAAALAKAAQQSAADQAAQLKIIQEEKSAVSKLTEEYTALLKKDAEAREKAMEDAKIAARASAANRLREGASANLQIQGSGSTPRIGGTQQFRRRPLQPGTTPSYGGLSQIKSGMVNL